MYIFAGTKVNTQHEGSCKKILLRIIPIQQLRKILFVENGVQLSFAFSQKLKVFFKETKLHREDSWIIRFIDDTLEP